MYIYSLPTSSPRTRTFERVSFHGLNPQARRECGGPFAGGEKRDCVSVCDGRGAVIVIFGEGRECPRVCVCAVASSYGCEGFCAAERLKKVAPSWDLVDLDRNPGHGRQSLGRYLAHPTCLAQSYRPTDVHSLRTSCGQLLTPLGRRHTCQCRYTCHV